MKKKSIIIIGAGATGLMAAKELCTDYLVTVLEAQSHIGGRIHSINEHGNIIEAGAEFVHGNLPVTLGLLREAGITFIKTQGKMYRKQKGGFATVDEMADDQDELLKKIAALKEDITMKDLLEKYFQDDDNASLRRHIKNYVEGFDLADISRVSVKALYNEWNAEEYDNFRIPAGYMALVQYLQQHAEAKGCNFYTGMVINEVQWQEGSVTVHSTNGQKYIADKLLVTVPVSVLQQPGLKASIQYTPPIQQIENAARNIGFGAVIKVIVKFKTPFWQKDAGFIFSDEVIPTWWTQLPGKEPVLTGWLGGPGAAAISNDTDDNILEKAISSLAAIFDITQLQLKRDVVWAKVFNWQKNGYIMGGYSYDTVQSEEAKRILSSPISGTIFFAGEGLYTGDHPGTVEAAFVSGMNAAAAIKKAGLSLTD